MLALNIFIFVLVLGSSVSLNKINDEKNNHNTWESGIREDAIDKKLENEYEVCSGIWSTPNRSSRARQVDVPILMQPPEVTNKIYIANKDHYFIKPSKCIPAKDTNIISQLKNDSSKFDLDGKINRLYITKQYPAITNNTFSTKREESRQPLNNLSTSSLWSKNHISESFKTPVHKSVKRLQQFPTVQPLLSQSKKNLAESAHLTAEVSLERCRYVNSHQSNQLSAQQQYSERALDMKTSLSEYNDMAVKRNFFLTLNDNFDRTKQSNIKSANDFRVNRQSGHLNERAFSFSIRQEHRSRSFGSVASFESFNIKK